MNGFERYLQQQQIIPHTIRRHGREIKRFIKWLKHTRAKHPENVQKKDIIAYLQYLKEKRNLANATQNQVFQSLKKYYAYLAEQYDITDITLFIKIHGIKRKLLHPVATPDELEQLCELYYDYIIQHTPTKNQLRFFADYHLILQARYIALTLIVYQGINPREIIQFTKDNFDFRKGTIHIHKSLKAAERILPLHASQIAVLLQFFNNNDNNNIIPNKNHLEHLNQTLKTLHPKYKDLLHIRYCKIVHWIKLYGLRKAQYMAGHKNISSTEKYLAGDVETLQNDITKYHPL